MTAFARLLPAVLTLTLAACASSSLDTPNMEQTGKLKVNPALLGQPAPASSAQTADKASPK